MDINPEAVKEIRRRQGLTQANLAEDTGISRAHIGSIETGRRPAHDIDIRKIARALRVKVEVITGGE